jgi:hypothetical protein
VWEQAWECSIPGAAAARPLVALSAGGPSALTPLVHAGDLEIALGPDAALFVPAVPLFIASFSGIENRSLGHALSNDSGVVRFERSPGGDYSANSILWSPGAWHEWSTGRCPGASDVWDRGTELVRVGDGDALAMRLHVARRSTSLRIGPIPLAETDAFRAWLDAHARGGVDPFTWVDERGAVARAWIQSATLAEEPSDDGFVCMNCDLALDEPGSRV